MLRWMGWGEGTWKWGVQCEVTEDERSGHGRECLGKKEQGKLGFLLLKPEKLIFLFILNEKRGRYLGELMTI